MDPANTGSDPSDSQLDERAADVRERLRLTQAERLAVRGLIAEKEATVDDTEMFSWESQAGQYPPLGPPGISTMRMRFEDGRWINCLLYRESGGSLVGILNHYPVDLPPWEQKFTINVWVHPAHRSKGIATEMVLGAMQEGWPISVEDLKVTGSGLALTRSVARRVRRDVEPGGDPAASPGTVAVAPLPLLKVRSIHAAPVIDLDDRAELVWNGLLHDEREKDILRRRLKVAKATLSDDRVLSWETQARQYPDVGEPGISATTVELSGGAQVNCVLRRHLDGSLIGILNHYPVDIPPHQAANTINVWVHPGHRRRGVASEMVLAALQEGWAVDLERLSLSSGGEALLHSVVRRVDRGGPGEDGP